MNLNYLIRLSYWGIVSAAYFMLSTTVQAEETSKRGDSATRKLEDTKIEIKEDFVNKASDLLAQGTTRVTGVELNRTNNKLEVILKTAAGGERLVPFILPQGNSLIINILDATLGFSIRNGVEQINPAPGISLIRLDKIDDSEIRLTITGESQAPSAGVIPGTDDLVLSVTPERTTAEQEPDEEIQIIVTGETEDDDYNVTDASVGTRTDTPIQDVPQSIQIVPQEVIKDQQVTNITDALRNIPGVVPSDSNRTLFNNPTIRGFGGGFDFGIDVYRRNGLRDGQGASNTGDTANIERIEVLKGPSSVLYGQGSPGGIINLVTKQPLSEAFYAVEGEIGNYNFYRGTLDLSGPLDENKNLLYRLNVAAETSQSFIDFYDRDRYLVNPVLAWNISDDTKLTLEFEYRSVRSLNDAGLPARGTVLDNPNGDLPLSRYAGEPDIDIQDTDTYRIGYNFEHQFSENWSIRNAFDTVLSRSNSLRLTNSRLDPDGRTLNRNYFDNGDGFDVNAYTLDTYTVGKFKTGSVEHELVAGIELSRNEVRSNNTFLANVDPIDLFNPQYGNVTLGEPAFFFDRKTTSDGLGIYLQDQVTLSDKFIVVLGGRFDILTNEVEDFNQDTNEFQQNEGFSPRIGLVYKPIEDISVYASYSRSLEQSVGESFDGSVFDPGRGTQYEIGVKGDISDRLSATLALYDLTRTNVSTNDPDNPNFQIQTGEQNSQGIELSVAGEILPGWNITGGYAYTDAVITEDNFEEDNRLNNAPKNAVSLWTTYEIQQGSVKGLGFGAGLFFVGERQGDLENSFELPSYTRTDAAIFYQRGKFRTALNFRNLFDIDYFEAADNDLEVFPGDPFTILGSVSVEF